MKNINKVLSRSIIAQSFFFLILFSHSVFADYHGQLLMKIKLTLPPGALDRLPPDQKKRAEEDLKRGDSGSSKPLAGVIVQVGSQRATTNKDGIFVLKSLAPNIREGLVFLRDTDKKAEYTFNTSIIVPTTQKIVPFTFQFQIEAGGKFRQINSR